MRIICSASLLLVDINSATQNALLPAWLIFPAAPSCLAEHKKGILRRYARVPPLTVDGDSSASSSPYIPCNLILNRHFGLTASSGFICCRLVVISTFLFTSFCKQSIKPLLFWLSSRITFRLIVFSVPPPSQNRLLMNSSHFILNISCHFSRIHSS